VSKVLLLSCSIPLPLSLTINKSTGLSSPSFKVAEDFDFCSMRAGRAGLLADLLIIRFELRERRDVVVPLLSFRVAKGDDGGIGGACIEGASGPLCSLTSMLISPSVVNATALLSSCSNTCRNAFSFCGWCGVV